MLLVLGCLAALVPVADVCDRRADIQSVRAASPPARAELRKRVEAEVNASSGRAHACAAAVAAEAARVDGDKLRTLALLDDVVGGLPELAVSLAPHRALLLAELNRVPEAETALAGVPETAVVWRLRIELAIARAKKDDTATTTLLRKLSSRDPEALGALCDGGDVGACGDLLLRYAGHPAARARESALGRRLANTPARTRALLAAGRPRQAAAESEGVSDVEGIAARVDALLRLARIDEAIEISSPPGDEPVDNSKGAIDTHRGCDADGGELASLDYALAKANAKARSRAGDVKGALARYDEILSFAAWHQVDKKELAEAAFFAAFTLIESDDVDGALLRLQGAEAFVQDSVWDVQTKWQRAFLLLSAKHDAKAALPWFDAAIALKDKEVRKHRYWRARALDIVDPARAKRERQALINEEAVDWYGLLSRRDLGQAPLRGIVVAPRILEQGIVVDEEVRLIRLLYGLGFDAEARDRARARGLRDQRVSLPNIGLSQSVEDASFGWRRGGLYLPSPSTQKNRLVPSASWRVSYPTPWREVVDAAAAASGSPSSFVYAIMRTESGFDAAASSSAGAQGVLQLLPSVARGLAGKDASLPAVSTGVRDDIALGAALLGLMVKEHGSLLMAAAAYNGAPENAQAWAKRFSQLPVDVFVERVPFKETREYIKRVLVVEAMYRALDGGVLTLDLPERLSPATTFSTFPYDE